MSWVHDLVPAALRRDWVAAGLCPDRDLYRLFRDHARAHPDRPALVDERGTVDYGTLHAQVGRTATHWSRAGLGPGDIIGIRLPNGRDAVAAELAVWALGAVALPYPDGNGRRDTASLLGRSRAAALVAEPSPGTGMVHRLTVPPWGSCVAPEWRPPKIDPESPARILVSSGSEAEPKMVAYSHNAMGGGRAAYLRALSSGDTPMRNFVLVPLASSFGSCGVPVTVAALGGTLLVRAAFDAAAALAVIAEHRPTHVFGVPTMLRRIADTPGPLPSVPPRLVSSGAALPAATAEVCQQRFGRPVIAVYGSADGVNCHTARTGPVGTGRPDPAVARIRIIDEQGDPLPAGTPGEISALGPMTPLCYVTDAELDARYRLPGGWVRTGDRGVLDRDGILHVLGRLKQVVIRGGYNISPAEVERELGAHPAVAEVACVGVPDPDLGERLCACIAQKPGSAAMTLAALHAYLHTERGLERRKLPERLVVLPALPVGATGKICRPSLVEIACSEIHIPEQPQPVRATVEEPA